MIGMDKESWIAEALECQKDKFFGNFSEKKTREELESEWEEKKKKYEESPDLIDTINNAFKKFSKESSDDDK